MKEGISGFVFAKNAIKLDYCLELAARSLLPVVDELILCDSNSTDETTDLMYSINGARVINYDVTNPCLTPLWCPNWRNYVREHCKYKMHITLDADEVLDNSIECASAVRKSNRITKVRMLTFWRDSKTLIPFGVCEADYAVKIAPSDVFCQYLDIYPGLPPDPDPDLSDAIRIFHLGFVRKKQALFDKAKLTHAPHQGGVDQRFSAGHSEGKRVHEIDWGWNAPLRDYNGIYPPGVLEWINSRIGL